MITLQVPLKFDAGAGQWTMDFAKMEELVTPTTKMFTLCNPHNPVRVDYYVHAHTTSARPSQRASHLTTTPNRLTNPQQVGKVFTRAELQALGAFCKKHDLILLSDEIYHDLILDEAKTPHVPIAALDDAELMKRTIILHAASKTYNVPGLSCAYAVIPDEELRLRFKKAARCVGWRDGGVCMYRGSWGCSFTDPSQNHAIGAS